MVSHSTLKNSKTLELGNREGPTESAPVEQIRLSFLDGLRGFAILAVMLRHYYMATYHLGFPRWADIFGIEIGVLLFLALSGFGLSWSYLGPRKRTFSASDFFLRRVSRILPAYYVALLLAVLLSPSMPPGELIWQIGTHITLTHNLFSDTVLGVYGPFWSLALEFQFYLFFPIILAGFRRWGVGRTLLGILFFHLAFRIYAMRFGTDYNPYTFTVQWSVLGRLFSFALAMGAASVVAEWQTKPPSRLICNLLPVGTVLLLLAGVWTRRHLGVVHPLTGLAWIVGFVGVILWCCARKDVFTRCLQCRPLASLGVMSYSVFLVHDHVLSHLLEPWYKSVVNPPSPIVVLPFTLAAMVFVSWVFYRWVEKPLSDYFYRLRTQMSKKKAPGETPASAS
jgi:peptidoglycan/LPS O-acetylase OafA/YrhL